MFAITLLVTIYKIYNIQLHCLYTHHLIIKLEFGTFHCVCVED